MTCTQGEEGPDSPLPHSTAGMSGTGSASPWMSGEVLGKTLGLSWLFNQPRPRSRHGRHRHSTDSEESPIPGAQSQTIPLRLVAHPGHDGRVLRLHPAGRLQQGVPLAEAGRRRHHDGHPRRLRRDHLHHRHHRHLRQTRQHRVRRPLQRSDQGCVQMMPAQNSLRRVLTLLALFGVSFAAWAAGADLGQAEKQPTNWTAITMFAMFVVFTLFITKWSAAVMASGFDGLIYSIGFLVGWPVITFLMAERLRNLGKFTFADVAAFRFNQKPIRIFAASGTLVVVAFYLIAQMVGAGQLIKLLFGR